MRFREVLFLEFILLGIGLLTALLLGFWYIFFTGLPQKKRWVLLLIGIGFLLVVYFVIDRFTRVEGSIGGSGIPRLVWKWTPKREGAGRPLTLESGAALTNQPATTAGSEAGLVFLSSSVPTVQGC